VQGRGTEIGCRAHHEYWVPRARPAVLLGGGRGVGCADGSWARCRDDHRHITAQELSDPSVAVVMEGDPALVEGEIKGWRFSGRFARSNIAYRPILFGGCAEV